MAESTAHICQTCGTQFSPAAQPPADCPICQDERQYVGFNGQQWITPAELRLNHKNVITEEEPGLHSLVTDPHFAIGQRAFLLQTPEGNLLWDCLSLLDDQTSETVASLGGIQAIAISHPHYYTAMVDWSRRFGNAPIYLHEADRKWVMRPDPNINFWDGETKALFGDLSLLHTPGHFDGFQVAHWPTGAGGRGVLMAADQPQVCSDPSWVSFMYSYPNYIPLGSEAVEKILQNLRPWQFDRIYGAFPHHTVQTGAKTVLEKSAERYLNAIR